MIGYVCSNLSVFAVVDRRISECICSWALLPAAHGDLFYMQISVASLWLY